MNNTQQGYIDINLWPMLVFSIIGVGATGWLVVWLVRYLLQHLHWV